MEIEAKYAIQGPFDASAISSLSLKPYVLRDPQDIRRHDLLFDTPDHRFYHLGYVLRVRSVGHRLVVTLKRPGSVTGSVHRREEVEAPIGSAAVGSPGQWPAAIASSIQALSGETPVAPLVNLDIQRRTWCVECAGRVVAEVALDRGTMRVNKGTADIHELLELEVELKGAGTASDLRKLDRRLRQQLPLTALSTSKFARGMALLEEGEGVKASQGGFTPLAILVQRLINHDRAKLRKHGKRLRRDLHDLRMHSQDERRLDHEQWRANLVDASADVSERIHAFRVTIRRLRSALQLAELIQEIPGQPTRSVHRVQRRLRAVGQVLGAVRDAEIVQERLTQLRLRLEPPAANAVAAMAAIQGRAPGQSGSQEAGEAGEWQRLITAFDEAQRLVERDRQGAWRRLQALLKHKVVQALATDLRQLARRMDRCDHLAFATAEATQGKQGKQVARALSPEVVRVRHSAGSYLWTQLEELLREGDIALRSRACPEERHRLRRACKRFRYSLECLQATLTTPYELADVLAPLVEAQNQLGKLQDDALLMRSLQRVVSVERKRRPPQRQTVRGAERPLRVPRRHPLRANAYATLVAALTESQAHGVQAFWPVWEVVSGAPFRAALASAIAQW